MTSPGKVKKRDGTIVEFNSEKIKGAIEKACNSVGIFDTKVAENISQKVVVRFQRSLKRKCRRLKTSRIGWR